MNANELAEHLDHIVSQDLLELFDIGVCVDSANLLRTIPALEAEIEALKQAKAHERMNYLFEIEALKKALKEIIAISDRNHNAWNKAKELLK